MSARLEALSERVKEALGGRLAGLSIRVGEITAVLPASEMGAAMTALRDHAGLRFETSVPPA